MNKKQKYRLIKQALEEDNRDLAHSIIDSYEIISDINYQPAVVSEGSLLEIAIKNGQDDIACRLFDMGMRIGLQVNSETSYVILAVKQDMPRIIEKLCKLEELNVIKINEGFIQNSTFIETNNLLKETAKSSNPNIITSIFNKAVSVKIKEAQNKDNKILLFKEYRLANIRKQAKNLEKSKQNLLSKLK